MRKHSKQQQNLKQYNHKKDYKIENEAEKQIDAIEFAIAIIYCGFPETEAREFAALIGKHPPSYRQITKAFNLLRPILMQLANDSVLIEKNKMPEGSAICVDGSWDHRRDGHLHIFDVICIQTGKIIDFSIQMRKSDRKNGNTIVSPQAMEGVAFKEIIPRLMSNPNIIEIVKDGDVQLEAIIVASGWNITIRQDTNHLLKHFPQHFDNCVNPLNFMFRGICKKLLKKFKCILYRDESIIQKYSEIQELRNAILTKPFLKLGRAKEPHLWKYANDVNAVSKLDNVINLCNNITSSFVRYHSTCLNECFHSVKAKFVPKNYNLGNTADVRTYAAILQFNIGSEWLDQLYNNLDLPKTNLDLFKDLFPRAHDLFKSISHNDDYYQRKLKEEEEEEGIYAQYQRDKMNNIPMHS